MDARLGFRLQSAFERPSLFHLLAVLAHIERAFSPVQLICLAPQCFWLRLYRGGSGRGVFPEDIECIFHALVASAFFLRAITIRLEARGYILCAVFEVERHHVVDKSKKVLADYRLAILHDNVAVRIALVRELGDLAE